MKLFKNKEITRICLILLALGFAACGLCLLFDARCAVICAFLTAAAIAACIIDAAKRYRAMSELSDDIDRVLGGADNIDLSRYTEGELGILQNELTKLTVRLREQSGELKRDKQLLADSIADISHQIRTPLTAVNLLLAALGEPDITEEKQGQIVRDMHRQLSRIDWLISALLKLARLDADAVSMSFKTVPLAELVEDSLAPVAIQMELRDQKAVVSAQGSITCDPSWLAEALTNIIKNCSEHMDSGELFIEARENPLYSEITVRDTGSGIDKADLPHIFERFYKGRNSTGSGVGIGLALCRMIVSKQNGTVKAENDLSGGAKFTVRIYKSAV